MRVFHETKTQSAGSIWSDDFRDSEVIEGYGCAGQKFVGVQLFNNPIGWNLNPDGNNLLLAIEIPEDAVWLGSVPLDANVASQDGPPIDITDGEEDYDERKWPRPE